MTAHSWEAQLAETPRSVPSCPARAWAAGAGPGAPAPSPARPLQPPAPSEVITAARQLRHLPAARVLTPVKLPGGAIEKLLLNNLRFVLGGERNSFGTGVTGAAGAGHRPEAPQHDPASSWWHGRPSAWSHCHHTDNNSNRKTCLVNSQNAINISQNDDRIHSH